MQEQSLCTEKIVNRYMEAAIAYGNFLGKDSKKTNKQFGIIKECYIVLKSLNLIISLTPLLKHENESVRLWSASHLLFVEPKASESVLKELNLKSDLLGFTAMITLEEWEKGRLKFDYE